MLKLTRTYNDYNGGTRTKDFYFNLTQAEVTEMELSVDGGLVEMINRIVAAKDGKQIIEVFKDIILRSYGEKSPDGERFIKNQELRDAFSQTEAYSDLFMELATDPDAASNFVNGIIPKIAGKKEKEKKETQPQLLPTNTAPDLPAIDD